MVSTVSRGLAEIITTEYNIPKTKIEIIYNGYFEEYYYKKNVDIDDWSLLYSGTYYEKYFNIYPLIKALKIIQERKIPVPDIRFSGNENKYLDNIFSSVRVKVNYIGNIPQEKIAAFQRKATILLNIDSVASKGILKTKSFEYSAAKRPILSIMNPEGESAKLLLKKEYKGYCVSTDAEEIADFISYWYNRRRLNIDPSNFVPDTFIEVFTRKNQAIKYLKKIKEKLG